MKKLLLVLLAVFLLAGCGKEDIIIEEPEPEPDVIKTISCYTTEDFLRLDMDVVLNETRKEINDVSILFDYDMYALLKDTSKISLYDYDALCTQLDQSFEYASNCQYKLEGTHAYVTLDVDIEEFTYKYFTNSSGKVIELTEENVKKYIIGSSTDTYCSVK